MGREAAGRQAGDGGGDGTGGEARRTRRRARGARARTQRTDVQPPSHTTIGCAQRYDNGLEQGLCGLGSRCKPVASR